MTRILVALGLAALFAGGALAASNVQKLPILSVAEQTTSAATTTGGTTATGTTGTTTGTTTTGTTTGQEGVRAGKVRLCHRTGSASSVGVEIVVSRRALPEHRAHGDTEGRCLTTTTTTTGTTATTTTGTTTTGTTTGQEGVREGKVRICHKTGSSRNPGVEIEVSENALPAHLAHGDTEGECEDAATTTTGTTATTTTAATTTTQSAQPKRKVVRPAKASKSKRPQASQRPKPAQQPKASRGNSGNGKSGGGGNGKGKGRGK
jgi:hypothetical protein